MLLLSVGWFPPGLQAVPAATPVAVVPEYNAKAGYLLLFTRYVGWPAGTFVKAGDPVVIGVLGTNPFGDVLERTVREAKSQDRPVEVRLVRDAAEAARCQVVFIARGQERDEMGWLEALRGKPVLTVTESTRGLDRGAVISLALEETGRGARVIFSASLPAARQSGLQIRASMLTSARKVLREPAKQRGGP